MNTIPSTASLALILLLAAGPAYADNIDQNLIKHGPKLIAYVQKHEYVGVLKFRVKKGTGPITFSAGALNNNMVTRIENLLVLSSDPKKPVHLLNDPGLTIAKKRARLSYLTAEKRGELFKLRYPVVGSEKPVQADAFLTGRVDLSPDYRQTTVTIYGFTRANVEPEKVLTFTTPTDRPLLADVSQNFLVMKRGLEKEDLDKEDLDKKAIPEKPETPVDISKLVGFQILYNGDAQTIGIDPAKKLERVVEPREGQTVVMRIKNLGKQRLGVVLMVNGKSTLFDEEGELGQCRKWILDPGEEYTIKGYYCEDESVIPFKVLPDDMPDESMSPGQAGQIQVAVFDGIPEKEKKVSLQGVSRSSLKKKRVRSFAELRKYVGKTTRLERTPRGLIVPFKDTEKEVAKLKRVPFDNASLVGCRTIVYFDPKKDKEKPEEKEKGKQDEDKKR